MNRRLWAAVAATLLTLALASALAGPARFRSAPTAIAVAGSRLGALADRVPWWLAASIGALAVVALGVVLWRERRGARGHRAPWHSVIVMSKRGHHPLSIARATGLAQDVVRIVLAPVSAEAPPSGGNSFRPPSARGAEMPRPERPRLHP